MAGFKKMTLRKFLSKKGKGQELMVNFKENKKLIQQRLTLHICPLYLESVGVFITVRQAGKYYAPLSTNQ